MSRKAHIRVTLRPSILDPQGKAIEHALGNLGLDRVRSARIGKYIELEIEADSDEDAREVAEEACRKLLANPVMEDFVVAFAEETQPA